ncbi:MipA/OmpV family protein [Marinobacter sp. 1Y8]
MTVSNLKPLALLASCWLIAGTATAQTGDADGEKASTGKPSQSASADDDWQVMAGLGVGFAPEYRGADSDAAIPLPYVSVRKGRFFADILRGIGWNVIQTENWTVAPTISYARGRDNEGAISAFDDVDDSAMAGVLINWQSGHWELDSDLATPVTGDLEGWRLRGYVRYRARITERLSYAVGPGATWADSDWNDSLYGVSAADAARSGLDAYRADDSHFRTSLNGRLSYYLTRKLNLSLIARYSRLYGDAADSPIVEDVGDANQLFGSVLATYKF